MNKTLLSKLLEVAKWWRTGERDYAFETRLCMPVKIAYPPGGIVVIIDVRGFYRDEEWKDAIVLHHEEVFSTPNLFDENLTQQQIDNCSLSFSQKLDEYTQRAYTSFNDILTNESQRGQLYTSDIFWMK